MSRDGKMAWVWLLIRSDEWIDELFCIWCMLSVESVGV